MSEEGYASTTLVPYVKITPTISNLIQAIAIRCKSNPPLDVDRMIYRDQITIKSRSSCNCGHGSINTNTTIRSVQHVTLALPNCVVTYVDLATIMFHVVGNSKYCETSRVRVQNINSSY